MCVGDLVALLAARGRWCLTPKRPNNLCAFAPYALNLAVYLLPFTADRLIERAHSCSSLSRPSNSPAGIDAILLLSRVLRGGEGRRRWLNQKLYYYYYICHPTIACDSTNILLNFTLHDSMRNDFFRSFRWLHRWPSPAESSGTSCHYADVNTRRGEEPD